MKIPSMLLSEKAVVTTHFYSDGFGDGETAVNEIDGIYCCAKRKYGENGSFVAEGKIYADGDCGQVFALDGDSIGGKTVRRQFIACGGDTYTVSSVKKVYMGSDIHHFEIGVV